MSQEEIYDAVRLDRGWFGPEESGVDKWHLS